MLETVYDIYLMFRGVLRVNVDETLYRIDTHVKQINPVQLTIGRLNYEILGKGL